jgi:hypothetical protein
MNGTVSTVASNTSGARLEDVHIVRPYTISRHLILTVSDHDTSWKVSLRVDQPTLIPALHELLVANLGRTIAEIGELELHS